ncbi:hypothetical protein [Flexivirga caeni]|uniref:DUF732 domain-containing protein n=1 Tax=Flexivirga caeni TaxID=2294115 RepID=A0A3M9MC59_9MICO|nr:hypothetical protein [Flexivirga caeni]RNI22168.1 hypothetical protein EFY87_09305 [Flexivirga caeni]
MRSLHFKLAAAAGLLLALPLGLAACSSGTSHKAVSSPTSSSAAAPSTSPSTASGGYAKPSKAQVAAGMTNYFVGKGVPRSLVGNVTNCVADKGYSQFSEATLLALKNGKIEQLNPLDATKLAKVTTSCLAGGVPTAG